MIDWRKSVASRLNQYDPAGDLLHRVKGKMSRATVYNFLSGKTIKSDLLAIILEAVDLEVVPKPKEPEYVEGAGLTLDDIDWP